MATSDEDQTPLLRFALGNHGSAAVIAEIIDSGADVNVQNSWGMTPLVKYLFGRNPNKEIVEVLVEGGADVDVNIRDKQ